MSDYVNRKFKEVHLVIPKDHVIASAIVLFLDNLGELFALRKLLRLRDGSYHRYGVVNPTTNKIEGYALVKTDVLGNSLVCFDMYDLPKVQKKIEKYAKKMKG